MGKFSIAMLNYQRVNLWKVGRTSDFHLSRALAGTLGVPRLTDQGTVKSPVDTMCCCQFSGNMNSASWSPTFSQVTGASRVISSDILVLQCISTSVHIHHDVPNVPKYFHKPQAFSKHVPMYFHTCFHSMCPYPSGFLISQQSQFGSSRAHWLQMNMRIKRAG